MTTTPEYVADPIFAPLTYTQARNLANRIYDGVVKVSHYLYALDRMASGSHRDIDKRYHELHADLCDLHTDLFQTVMAKADESED